MSIFVVSKSLKKRPISQTTICKWDSMGSQSLKKRIVRRNVCFYLSENTSIFSMSKKGTTKRNKAGYMAIQSRMDGQEQLCKNRSQFKKVMWRMDRRTDGPTNWHSKVYSCVSATKNKMVKIFQHWSNTLEIPWSN